ncbi:hypothetical protein J421_5196 (plasmid) [Gemmatirosa kalamazoonensis]|uniref:Peptidase S1 and S6 chymotrypsin/Hap n=1 Tax=Gemmatirosa kalamazoonensis TaxID=861299 RepID=W0RPW5_9BACT|nr:hypothetical protein [Gemmatirosa kalamazoonensis]AHG92731.1 hypothetical protein J421_5196 [Gemmatirosa kalamazoonensis]
MPVQLPSVSGVRFTIARMMNARIVNARGVPGTLGSLARTLHDGRLVLLTSHHVLFGAGARSRQPVRLAHGPAIGRARHGRLGTVPYDGAAIHVDCAVASIDEAWLPDEATRGDEALVARVVPGQRVTKTGGATGTTAGVVVDVAYSAPALIDGRIGPAPAQILVRADRRGVPFCAPGDSGAVLRDADGAIVGLLWGVAPRGDGVASPIAPVLHVLHARPVSLR